MDGVKYENTFYSICPHSWQILRTTNNDLLLPNFTGISVYFSPFFYFSCWHRSTTEQGQSFPACPQRGIAPGKRYHHQWHDSISGVWVPWHSTVSSCWIHKFIKWQLSIFTNRTEKPLCKWQVVAALRKCAFKIHYKCPERANHPSTHLQLRSLMCIIIPGLGFERCSIQSWALRNVYFGSTPTCGVILAKLLGLLGLQL